MFQGPKTEKELNYRPFPFDPDKIDAVLLSHAHIDHAGLLPKLVRHGFAGPIHATPATADLAGVMLPDSAHIQEIEVEQLNRRAARRDRGTVSPIYGAGDVDACLKLFRPQPYDAWFAVLPGLRARFWNAGHLLGSASIEIEVAQADAPPLRLLFSGDIGPDYKLMHPDPEAPSGLDYVICESTYGDRDRIDATADHRRKLLSEEVKAAMHPHGVLLIPSFAVERAQELISDLGRLMAEGALPLIPVYVDSPLATKATRVFAKHHKELEEGAVLMQGLVAAPALHRDARAEHGARPAPGVPHRHRGLGHVRGGADPAPAQDLALARRGDGLFTGFQAVGTLGRILQDGARSVRIQGEEFTVRARIRTLDLYSGHADGTELRDWIAARLPIRHEVFLVHGEEAAMAALARRLTGIVDPAKVLRPELDEGFALTPKGSRRIARPRRRG
jgi:metallo-beta-lactamase family protein